jgi:hypothetical protein
LGATVPALVELAVSPNAFRKNWAQRSRKFIKLIRCYVSSVIGVYSKPKSQAAIDAYFELVKWFVFAEKTYRHAY